MLESDDIQLLTQIGFLAATRADVPRAEIICGALLCVRPDRAFGHVGLATALLNAGRAADAAALLERARLPPGEEADMLQAFLGLALQLDSRHAQASRVLRKLVSTAQATDTAESQLLARQLLGDCEPHHAVDAMPHAGQ